MKTLKTIVALTLVMVALCSALTATAEMVDYGEFYPLLTVVLGSERVEDFDLWEVECMDQFGRVWAFFADCYEWEEGDLCNLLMWAVGETETSHEIIEVYYVGHLEEGSFLQWGE